MPYLSRRNSGPPLLDTRAALTNQKRLSCFPIRCLIFTSNANRTQFTRIISISLCLLSAPQVSSRELTLLFFIRRMTWPLSNKIETCLASTWNRPFENLQSLPPTTFSVSLYFKAEDILPAQNSQTGTDGAFPRK
jgi:hypothetical protein